MLEFLSLSVLKPAQRSGARRAGYQVKHRRALHEDVITCDTMRGMLG